MKIRVVILSTILLTCASQGALVSSAKDKWISVRTRNFLVVSNSGEAEARRIAASLEQFRHVISMLLSRAKIRSSVPTKILLFNDHGSFRPFKPKYKGKIRDNVGGYFFGDGDQSYIALTTDLGGGAGARYNEVIFHEYQHFVVGNNLTNAPPWLGEGLAEYYSTFEPKEDGRRVLIGRPLAHHVQLLRAKPPLPLKTLFDVDHKSPEYNESGKAGLFYAQSWALVHYLMLGSEGRRQPQFERFIGMLLGSGADARPIEAKFKEAFQTDYKTIEAELLKYISKFAFPAVIYTFPQQIEFAREQQVAALTEAEAEFHLGDLLLASRRYDEAEKRLQRSVEMNANCADCRIGLGALRYRQQRYEEAKAQLQAGQAIDPKNWQGPFYYGAALRREERYDEAIKSYFEAIKINPNLANVYLDLSYAYLATGQQQDADEFFRRALGLSPFGVAHYRTRSYELLRLGRGKQAAEDSLHFLKERGWQDDSAVYAALAAYFGYRMDKLSTEAGSLLDEMAAKAAPAEWPYPVIKYLKRSLSLQQLISAAKENGELTEAHGYAGMDLSLNGVHDEAIPHLQWVKEKGERNFVEYEMALGELKRIEKLKQAREK